MEGGEPLVEVHTAAAEVGQGIVTVQAQIARTELGVERVAVLDADTRVGSAGSTSASRQTYVTGGAVKAACEAVRERLEALAAERGVTADPAAVLEEGEAIEETIEWRHRPTHPLDEDGQGDAHVQYAFSAHRAVVDVDTELGLVRVVELATAQEVGQGHEPAGARGPDRGRQRAGARASRCSRRSRSWTARSSTRPSPTTCCRRSSTCRRCASRCSSTPTPRRRTA